MADGFPVDPLLTARAARLLLEIGETELARRTRVVFNPRLRSTAGRADWQKRLVMLNPLLIGLAEDEPERTLRHELAHLVARARARGRRIASHGPEWRLACAALGIPGERATHSLPLPRFRQARRHHYQCPACLAVVSRARPIKRPSACAVCCRKHAGGRYHPAFRLLPVKAAGA